MRDDVQQFKGPLKVTMPRPSIFRWAAEIALRREQQRFSPVFYALHCRRISGALRSQSIWLSLAGVLAGIACAPIWFGRGDSYVAAFAAALFIFILLGSLLGTIDNFRARILPFFSQRLQGTDTWMAGKALLWNSRALRNIAFRLGVRPLCDFASGDPLIPGETAAMFDAEDALTTIEVLLHAEDTAALGMDVVQDLTKLRNALTLAKAQTTRFSLHLREGSGPAARRWISVQAVIFESGIDPKTPIIDCNARQTCFF